MARRVAADEDRPLRELLDLPLQGTGEVDELHDYDRWAFHIGDAINMPHGAVGVNPLPSPPRGLTLVGGDG
jgi:hypothetical protein